MGFSQKGDFDDIEQLGARMRAGLQEAGHMVGRALVSKAKMEILKPKHGRKYASLPYVSSAPGEYSAHQTGVLLNSIKYRMSGTNYIAFYSDAPHAGFQEDGTSKMDPRRNLIRAIEESDGLIRNIIEQVVWRAIKAG